MVVESAGDVLSISGVDGLGHVEDLGLPGVLPAGFGPEEALVPNAKHHLNTINYHQQNQTTTRAYTR